tara:strand:+ start:4196 stop:4456 length:261 start_codon:yes stop_codon:yes gene_type:complete
MIPAPRTRHTRSGRVSKAPERMKPTEDVVDDDYSDDEYDTEYEITDDDVSEDDSDDECTDSDEDENGNLVGFIVSDKEISDDEYEA